MVIDSIQMIYKPDIPAAPGSVTQLRDCCMDLVYLAKASGIAVIFVGHVTKAGTLAGPKIIEHIVDTVVYFEGDRFHAHRIVRCVKNRFGSTHEVGLFEMTGEGLREVTDPGNLFLDEYGTGGPPSGSVITAAMQGSRVLLVEVQALTASSVIGAAKRKVSGVSSDRVGMIIAVLEKRAELRLAADDVFVNIAGGVKVIEPAVDLAIALAIASAHTNRPLPAGHAGDRGTGIGRGSPLGPATRNAPARSLAPGPRPRHRPAHGRTTSPSSGEWRCTRFGASRRRWRRFDSANFWPGRVVNPENPSTIERMNACGLKDWVWSWLASSIFSAHTFSSRFSGGTFPRSIACFRRSRPSNI